MCLCYKPCNSITSNKYTACHIAEVSVLLRCMRRRERKKRGHCTDMTCSFSYPMSHITVRAYHFERSLQLSS